jgi:farnesyl-diphosphate farnesyltransferase
VALAYVLARASDTLADAPMTGMDSQRSQAIRLSALKGLLEAIMGNAAPETISRLGAYTLELGSSAERKLLELLPDWLASLREQHPADRQLIAEVCALIIGGQQKDLERFPSSSTSPEQVVSLAKTQDLDDYTWQVAGCVGRFWSLTCEAHLPGWRACELERMVASGIVYGKSLQRLNILRDTGQDLAQGRCYWPAEELMQVGMDAPRLARAIHERDIGQIERVMPLMNQWIRETRAGLSTGLAYSGQITLWRLRAASALPALIGLLTLDAIEKAGPRALIDPVKITRSQVRWILLRMMTSGFNRAGLARLGVRLGAQDLNLNKETP